MKKIYNVPQCEITVLNLQDSVLDEFPIGGESGGGPAGGQGGTPSNTALFDENEDDFVSPKSSLWD